MCFRCMLHMFHLDVAKVDLVLHMLQWLYTYFASVCFKCFSYFKRMLQSVLSGYCICCSGNTCMLQVYVPNVSPVSHLCCKCFIWMFHIAMLPMFRHLLQASIQNISSVSDVCCKCVYMDVIVTIHIYCKCMFINVSPVSTVCCRSAFMLQH